MYLTYLFDTLEAFVLIYRRIGFFLMIGREPIPIDALNRKSSRLEYEQIPHMNDVCDVCANIFPRSVSMTLNRFLFFCAYCRFAIKSSFSVIAFSCVGKCICEHWHDSNGIIVAMQQIRY